VKGGCLGALGCLGVLVLAVTGIVVLGAALPRTTEQDERDAGEPHIAPDPDAYLPRVGSRHGFGRTETADGRYHLSFGFIDHHGQSVDIRCSVQRADHEHELAAFGYDEHAIDAALDAELLALTRAYLDRQRLSPYLTVRFYGSGGYDWQSSFDAIADDAEHARVRAGIRRLDQWMDTTLDAARERIHARLLKERGFLLEKRSISIDYASLAERGTDSLADCARALAEAAATANDRRALGLYLAFVQELPYELPPDRLAGREILGFWVPSEVLVNDHGDCDSKSVAFCALWRTRPQRALIVILPHHALVAVEGKPGPGESYVRLGNRYYLLCEAAGPAKIHPGGEQLSGDFHYVEVAGGAGPLP
jgi:hypothetical protein